MTLGGYFASRRTASRSGARRPLGRVADGLLIEGGTSFNALITVRAVLVLDRDAGVWVSVTAGGFEPSGVLLLAA